MLYRMVKEEIEEKRELFIDSIRRRHRINVFVSIKPQSTPRLGFENLSERQPLGIYGNP